MKNPFTQEKFMEILDSLYDKSIKWDETYKFDSAEVLWDYFLKKYINKEIACEKLIRNQKLKTWTSGFFASLWWIITIPITVPTDMYITFLVEIRMIISIAYIWWYDVKVPELRTIVYAILLWREVKDVFIKSWLKPIWKKITLSIIKRIPEKLLIWINKKIWIKLFAKFWWKWFIQLWLAVPIIWWLIWWWINFYFTKRVWVNAMESFILEEDDSEKEL